jgi:LysR family transcriptional regulator, mexEF-oprN operon transcriptional activator
MNEIDLKGFDLNLLVVFDVLMAECSVTRAAERLNRTQSAISHALSRLRERLDDPLLVKSGRRIAGHPLRARADRTDPTDIARHPARPLGS